MHIRLVLRRVRSARPAIFFCGNWSWNHFYGPFLTCADSSRAVVSYWRKDLHKVLVICLGLSLSRKTVISLTGHLVLTIVVDWDVKQQNKQNAIRHKFWKVVGLIPLPLSHNFLKKKIHRMQQDLQTEQSDLGWHCLLRLIFPSAGNSPILGSVQLPTCSVWVHLWLPVYVFHRSSEICSEKGWACDLSWIMTKTNHVPPCELMISLPGHAVWSGSLLGALWVAKDPKLLQEKTKTDQTV